MSEVITIGIPTRNRILTIDRVLDSISSQAYPKHLIKIIFVDESDDGTFERLLKWKQENDSQYFEIRIIRDFESKGYISALRNVCVANMEGNIIFFWDSDVVAPDNESLGNIISLLNEDSVGAAGLPYYSEHPTLYERILKVEEVVNVMGFTAIKRSVFDKIGSFNEQLKIQEDADLIQRIISGGLKVEFCKSTPALHLKPNAKPPSFKDEVSDYTRLLKYCFTKESTLVEGLIRSGSKAVLLRALYYLSLPILLVLWTANLFVTFFPVFFFTTVVVGYILLNLFYQVSKAKKNRLIGFVAFFYRTPMGIASYYGYLFSRVKRALSRNSSSP